MAGTPNAADLAPQRTDPHEISQLWSLVRSGATMSDEVRRSNRTRRQPQTLYPATSPSTPRGTKRKQPPTNSTAATSSRALRTKNPTTSTSTTQSRTSSDLTVRSPEFWDTVIAPCNVEKIEGDTEEPEDHFEIDEEEREPLKGLNVNNISGATMPVEVRRFNRVRKKPQTLYPNPPPPQPSPRKQKRKQPPTSPKAPPRVKRYLANTRTTPSSVWSSSYPAVGDAGFWDAIIAPCNVKVEEKKKECVNVHFGLSTEDQAPFRAPASVYSKFEGLKVNNIFNDTTDEYCEMVANEYKALISYKDSNEAEFQRSSYYLFKFEARNPGMAKDYIFRTEATPQGSVKPDPEQLWSTPPSFPPNSAQCFDYDISPGLLYWLSLNGFPPRWEKAAKSYVYIKGQRKLCPYLAVEYRTGKSNEDKRVAFNQITGAMLLCLWNRFQLRKRALAAQEKDWKQEENSEIKVYGVRVYAEEYDVWVMTPIVNSEGEWQGTTMKLLTDETLQEVEGVQLLCLWINEIHRWALTIHAQQVREDVRALESKGGVPGKSVLFIDPS